MKVAAYILKGNGLAERVVPYMIAGCKHSGCVVDVYTDRDYKPDAHPNKYNACVLWGFVETCQNIMKGFKDAKKTAVYLDLAYWRRESHYKVSVNDRHPTAYFQKIKHDNARRRKFVPTMAAMGCRKNNEHILLAGMSAKAAWAEKQEPAGSWEKAAVEEIRKHTDRPIIYRPKPSWGGAQPIFGTIWSGATTPLEQELARTNVIVTHHSNVGVDGLAEGIPVFSKKGVASVMGLVDLSKINEPYYPPDTDREQFFNDLSYCQWSEDEMRNGMCWRHLLYEGLVKK